MKCHWRPYEITFYDYDGQWGLSFPNMCLIVEEKPRKKPQLRKMNGPGIEPGPAR